MPEERQMNVRQDCYDHKPWEENAPLEPCFHWLYFPGHRVHKRVGECLGEMDKEIDLGLGSFGYRLRNWEWD